MKRGVWFAALILALTVWTPGQVSAASSNAGEGRWVNPISDVCWKCLFPMSVGSIKLASGPQPDTSNPSIPIQMCSYGVLYRIGLAIGY